MEKTDLVLIRAHGLDDGFRALPFGPLDIATYLEKFGFRVKIIDRHKDRNSFAKTLKEILYWNPRYVGIGALTSQVNDALVLGKHIRGHLKIPLIYGGMHFTVFPEEGLHYADIVVRGEGENALLEILNKGITEKGIYSGEPVKDLDLIPLPKKDLLKSLAWGCDSFCLLTSRGCPYNCFFCLDAKYKSTAIRYHSVEYALDFIGLAIRALGVNNFSILDDIFTINPERVFDFCRGIEKRGLHIKLSCFSRSGIDDIQMYKAMKKAGFYNIAIGVESGNNAVLKAINKRQTIEEVAKTVGIIKAAGLNVSATFMIGNITETEETIRNTIDFAKKLALYGSYVGYAQPFPGSRFYEIAQDYGTLLNKNVRSYWNNRITFVPRGLTVGKMKKMRRDFLKELNPQRPLLKKILDKIIYRCPK